MREIKHNPAQSARRQGALSWKSVLLASALALWAGWAAALAWLSPAERVPADWAGLWDGGSKPDLHPILLGVQTLRWGAAVDAAEGNPAYKLGGEKAVQLGNWVPPRDNTGVSFGAWVKISAPLLEEGLVPLGGTAPPNEWGIGAWNGKPAAWMTELTPSGRRIRRLEASQPWPSNRWVHIMVACQMNRRSLWIDGKLATTAEADYISPYRKDVWLGSVRPTQTRLAPPLPPPHGLPAPEFFIDDFVIFPRALDASEIAALASEGRGGLIRSRAAAERRTSLIRAGTPWIAAFSVLFAAMAYLPGSRVHLARFVRAAIHPAFISAWIIFILGTATTVYFTLRLAHSAAEADRERLETFSHELIQAGDIYIENIADLLRRARDLARENPAISQTEWRRWATENGFPWDYSALDGIGWAPRLSGEQLQAALAEAEQQAGWPVRDQWRPVGSPSDWQLPVRVFTWAGLYRPRQINAMTGWNWLAALAESTHPEGPRAQILSRWDAYTTPLALLRPVPTELEKPEGIFIYIPVYQSSTPPIRERNREFLGAVFAGIRVADMLQGYWRPEPRLFGARIITGTPSSREEVVADTGDFYPETARPAKPYLEKEVAIRTYGRRLWIQIWTTPAFTAHSTRYWPWVSAAVGGAFTLLSVGLVAFQTRARLKERAAAAELLSTLADLQKAQRERQAISRDIHDGAIQSLYAVQLHLERLPRLASAAAPAPLAGELTKTTRAIRGVIGGLRQFTTAAQSGIHSAPPRFQDLLESTAEPFRSASPARIEIQCDPAAEELNEIQAIELVNIAREAMSNAVRHGHARHIALRFAAREADLELQITDDGVGFNPAQPPRRGVGLGSMRQRARQAGGSLAIESSPGRGTAIRFSLPRAPLIPSHVHETQDQASAGR